MRALLLPLGLVVAVIFTAHTRQAGAATPPCSLECPQEAMLEREPECRAGYVDHYNAGCSGIPGVWVEVGAQANDCTTLCGKSCTYRTEGVNVEDVDWYYSFAKGGTVTIDAGAEFPISMFLVYNPSCGSVYYATATAEPCRPVSLSWSFPAGREFWIGVVPASSSEEPEGDYQFSVCGIEGGVIEPAKEQSWGSIKARFADPEGSPSPNQGR